MDYTPFEWKSGEVGGTPISAGRLNTIEQGLGDTSSELGAIQSALGGKATTGALTSGLNLKANVTDLVPLAIVQWTGSAWPAYSAEPSIIRQFYSTQDPNATGPTHYNMNDIWFKLVVVTP